MKTKQRELTDGGHAVTESMTRDSPLIREQRPEGKVGASPEKNPGKTVPGREQGGPRPGGRRARQDPRSSRRPGRLGRKSRGAETSVQRDSTNPPRTPTAHHLRFTAGLLFLTKFKYSAKHRQEAKLQSNIYTVVCQHSLEAPKS